MPPPARRCALQRRAALLAGGALAVLGAPLPECTWDACERCLPDAVVNATKLGILGLDNKYYEAALRIGRTRKAWDAQSIYGQITGILVREKLGVEIEYVDCKDEVMCYMGVNNCIDWENYGCGQLQVPADGGDVVMPAEGKVYADPLSDVMFEPFIFYESMARDNFAGSELDYDSRPGISIGPTGHTALTGMFTWPDVVERAQEDGVDLLWLGEYKKPEAARYFHTPGYLIRDGVVPEYIGCSSDVPFVQTGMDQHTAFGFVCNNESWWVTPACAAFGDGWYTKCVVMFDDDWGYVKPELYRSLIASHAPIAKAMVGYDAWTSLLTQRAYNLTFSWWQPDATVMQYHPRRIGLVPELEPQPNVVLKAAWSPALTADVRVQQFLQKIYMTTATLNGIMDQCAVGYHEGHQVGELHGPSFYQKVACDWVRGNEDVWSQWFPSATSCQQGQVFVAAAGQCVDCPRGTSFVRLRNGTQLCRACEPGRFAAAAGLLECAPCPLGSFQAESGSQQCSKCERGTRAAELGKAVCQPCEAGRAAATAGTSECTVCVAGTFSDPGATACTVCEVSTFANSTGSTQCMACEVPLITNGRGSVRSSDCICPQGLYAAAGGCLPCPERMICEKGSSESSLLSVAAGHGPLTDDSGAVIPYPQLKEEYWSSREDPLSVFQCATKAQCPGGDPGTCGENLEAQACAHCVKGFSWDGEQCRKCASAEKSHFVFPTVPLLLLGVVVIGMYVAFRDPYERWNSWSNSANALAFLALNHYQVLSLIRGTSIELPDLVHVTWSFWSFSEDVLSIFKFSCVGFTDFRANMAFRTVVPLALLGVTLACFFGSWGLAAVLKRPWLKMDVHRTWNVFFSLIFTFFNGIASVSLSLFKCTSNPNGKLTLARDPSVNCYEGAWNSLVVMAAFAVLLYCVGSGVAFLYAVCQATRKQRFSRKSFQTRWKFLFIKFRADVHWWSIALLVRGLLLNAGFVAVTKGLGQLYWVMFLETLYLCLTIVFMPWRHRGANVLSCIASFSIMYACALMAIYSERDSNLDRSIAIMAATFTFVPLGMFVLLAARLVSRGLGFQKEPEMPYEQLLEAASGLMELDQHALEAVFDASGEWDRFHILKFCEVVRTEFLGYSSKKRTVSRSGSYPSMAAAPSKRSLGSSGRGSGAPPVSPHIHSV